MSRSNQKAVERITTIYTSSSFKSMFGTPFCIGNARPDSGHFRLPLITSTSMMALCTFSRKSWSFSKSFGTSCGSSAADFPIISIALTRADHSIRGTIRCMNSGLKSTLFSLISVDSMMRGYPFVTPFTWEVSILCVSSLIVRSEVSLMRKLYKIIRYFAV